ncbi:hypothetical protein FRC96_06950 [Lujinxingia vulgaris]|uniref:Uncharacterized protein n=1 Tax=Lujinxingia vulgaris TaxID=2600176 RepID=A0A5C6XI53_9DELT|nr:hypothetical protein [Lujinxingia vulgaris]TXD39589.1 hypothetical protein FRC96_06950 [Lujinxingia vulgaris]
MTLPLIKETRFYIVAHHRVVAVLYGDTWAILPIEQKPYLLDRGFVFLHPLSVWLDRLEPVTLPRDPVENISETTFKGAVIDHRLARLVDELKWTEEPRKDPRFAGEFEVLPDLWGDEEE